MPVQKLFNDCSIVAVSKTQIMIEQMNTWLDMHFNDMHFNASSYPGYMLWFISHYTNAEPLNYK